MGPVVVGRVRGAHGLRGRLRVQCTGDAAEVLLGLKSVRLGRDEDDPHAVSYEVESAIPGRADEVRMTLEGVGRREQADALRGRVVLADPEQFGALPAGEYWAFQLVGCRVESTRGDEIGTVSAIWNTGAQQLLVVADPSGREQLIPAVRELLCQVDLEGRRLVVDPPPGLLDEG